MYFFIEIIILIVILKIKINSKYKFKKFQFTTDLFFLDKTFLYLKNFYFYINKFLKIFILFLLINL